MNAQRALLLTDLVDSTQLVERLGDAAAAELSAAHDRVARDLLRQWRGREIDKTDGMLMMFDSAADAVACALAYHAALAALPVALKARAGLHVGAVILRSNSPEDVAQGAKPLEVEGLAKPITARVMSLAHGGQTLLTADARAALGDVAWRLQSHGHWRIKGLAEPIELFEVGDERAPFLPPQDSGKVYRVLRQAEGWLPLRDVPHRLPAERDEFVGRQAVLTELVRHFDAGARLVSLLGIGGSGKTRLALRFARSWMGDFPGGAWFCDLSAARNADGIVHAVAQALDVPPSHDDPVQQLGHAMAGRGACLVILDNFEQVSRHAAETLGRWLDRAGQARFLVTSREVLGLPGEQAVALPPLDAADAVKLFLRRAAAARSDFSAAADARESIERLVGLLDGLPLAIELAAARVRAMSPQALLDRMGQRFQVLAASGARRDRQATLRTAFDWSWELLTDAEKMALAQLSVFEGSFGLDAAEQVLDVSACAGNHWPAGVLQSLVDKSFVRSIETGRYGLLRSVQDYAAEHLCTPGRFEGSGKVAEAQAQARHGSHFANRARLGAAEGDARDLDDMVVACRRAALSSRADAAVATLVGAWALLQRRGPFAVGCELAHAVAQMPALDTAARARVGHIEGCACDACGQAPQAQRHLLQALHNARHAGDVRLEAQVLNSLGVMCTNQARLEEARQHHADALAIARRIGDRTQECAALNGEGTVHVDLGLTHEARDCYAGALRAARVAGDRRWECGVLSNLGGALFNLGELATAAQHFQSAREVARELGDRTWEGNALCNLGALHLNQGRLQEARSELRDALLIAGAMGHVRLECIVHCNLGLVQFGLHDLPQAELHYTRALSLAHEQGDRRSEGLFLGYLGQLRAAQQRFDEARASLAEGERILQQVADRFSLGLLQCHRAELERLAGDDDAARAAWSVARRIEAEVNAGAESELGAAVRRVAGLFAGLA